MCYCLMALIAKMIQLTVFGTLRVGEVQVSVHFYLPERVGLISDQSMMLQKNF